MTRPATSCRMVFPPVAVAANLLFDNPYPLVYAYLSIASGAPGEKAHPHLPAIWTGCPEKQPSAPCPGQSRPHNPRRHTSRVSPRAVCPPPETSSMAKSMHNTAAQIVNNQINAFMSYTSCVWNYPMQKRRFYTSGTPKASHYKNVRAISSCKQHAVSCDM